MPQTNNQIIIEILHEISATGLKTQNALVKNLKAINKGSRDVGTSFKKMNLQFLGAIFFGQNIARTFKGMLDPALNAVGVFDIFGSMLEIFFLPAAMLLLDFVLALYDFMSSLPAPVQEFINMFVILGVVFGTIISLIGVVAVGLGSLVPVFGYIVAGITASGVGLIIMGIIAVIALLFAAWKTNFGGIQDHLKNWMNTIGSIFGGFVGIVDGVATAIDGIIKLLTGKPDEFLLKIDEAWQKIADGIGGIFKSVVDVWWAPIQDFIDKLAKIPVIGALFAPFSTEYKNLTQFKLPEGTHMYSGEPSNTEPLSGMPWNKQAPAQPMTVTNNFYGITDTYEITRTVGDNLGFLLNGTSRSTGLGTING